MLRMWIRGRMWGSSGGGGVECDVVVDDGLGMR